MSRRHVDDQAFEFSRGDLFKLLGHDFVVASIDKARPHLFHKSGKVPLGFLPLNAVLVLSQLRKKSFLLIDRQFRDLLSDRVDVHKSISRP